MQGEWKFIANMCKLKILAQCEAHKWVFGATCHHFFFNSIIFFLQPTLIIFMTVIRKALVDIYGLKCGKKKDTQQHGFWKFKCYFLYLNDYIYGVVL